MRRKYNLQEFFEQKKIHLEQLASSRRLKQSKNIKKQDECINKKSSLELINIQKTKISQRNLQLKACFQEMHTNGHEKRRENSKIPPNIRYNSQRYLQLLTNKRNPENKKDLHLRILNFDDKAMRIYERLPEKEPKRFSLPSIILLKQSPGNKNTNIPAKAQNIKPNIDTLNMNANKGTQNVVYLSRSQQLTSKLQKIAGWNQVNEEFMEF